MMETFFRRRIMRHARSWRWIVSLGGIVLALGGVALLGLGAATRPTWGDPARPVWYYGRLVPFGELLARGVEPHCHDGLGPGIITCYDTNEELAAATGLDLPGTDPIRVQALRNTMRASAPPPQGSSYVPMWYYGRLVPFEDLLKQGVEPHCHDGRGPGIITCYNTNEELAAATGLDLPGIDRTKVETLRRTGAVAPAQCAYYAVIWEHIYFGGRNFALCYDYNDFRSINFNDQTSSIFIPSGSGASTYFEDINYGGGRRTFTTSIPDLRTHNFNDVISSARRGN